MPDAASARETPRGKGASEGAAGAKAPAGASDADPDARPLAPTPPLVPAPRAASATPDQPPKAALDGPRAPGNAPWAEANEATRPRALEAKREPAPERGRRATPRGPSARRDGGPSRVPCARSRTEGARARRPSGGACPNDLPPAAGRRPASSGKPIDEGRATPLESRAGARVAPGSGPPGTPGAASAKAEPRVRRSGEPLGKSSAPASSPSPAAPSAGSLQPPRFLGPERLGRLEAPKLRDGLGAGAPGPRSERVPAGKTKPRPGLETARGCVGAPAPSVALAPPRRRDAPASQGANEPDPGANEPDREPGAKPAEPPAAKAPGPASDPRPASDPSAPAEGAPNERARARPIPPGGSPPRPASADQRPRAGELKPRPGALGSSADAASEAGRAPCPTKGAPPLARASAGNGLEAPRP